MTTTAYLSLGSNLGNREANLRTAIAGMGAAGRVLAVSSMYETEPVDVPNLPDISNRPWFLNCVVKIETDMTPRELLNLALGIESAMGRRRVPEKAARNIVHNVVHNFDRNTVRNFDRSIDIDIILFGDRAMDEPGMKIPHPAMHRRRFVLEPLVEIAPDVSHPIFMKTAEEMLAALPEGQSVRRL